MNTNAITLGVGASATCTITNNDLAPRLTLVKQVTNDNGGTAHASAWTLNATARRVLRRGAPAMGTTATNGPNNVTAGVNYTLSESAARLATRRGRPSVASPRRLVVRPATVNTNAITLGVGASATCTITNNDLAPRLTLVKQVTNDNGGTAHASAWTLNATARRVLRGARRRPA